MIHALIISVAEYVIVLPIFLAVIVLVRLKNKQTKRRFIIEMIAAGVVALLLANLASSVWFDARPFIVGHFTPLIAHSNDNGFPSDHTLLASLIGWVILAYSRKYGVVTLVVALLIGIARVLAGVHHPLDIVGSFIISALATVVVIGAVRLIQSKRL